MEKIMSDYSTSDIINYAIDHDIVALQNAVDDIMKERIAELLDSKKVQVAQKFFNSED